MDTGKLSEETSPDSASGADARAGTAPGADAGADAAKPSPPGTASPARLFFASFLMLFIELALIRWVTANNVFITNTTNFVLLASFLGIGVGFLSLRSGRDFLRWTPVALLAVVAFVLAFPVILQNLNGDRPFRGQFGIDALPRPVSLAIVFILCVAVMAGIGQGVARLFTQFQPLRAYRLDIAGSIAGIVVFSLLSFLNQPPLTWGVIAGAGLAVLLMPRLRWWQLAAVGAMVAMLGVESFVPWQIWSPYNKLSLQQGSGTNPALYVSANNIPYQAARSIPVMRRQKQFYFLPYQHVSRADLGNVLIIGAGSGDDTAVAVSEGARHIDSVEIDPLLLKVGKEHSPAHPYQSSRVTTHVGDGREYLQNTDKKYNLILYALPDSLTAIAGQTPVRLESFLLTSQALQAARSHLAPGGTFAMYNYYAPFLLSRYATTVETVFHQRPCVNQGQGLGGRQMAVLTVRRDAPAASCTTFWHGRRVAPVSDNRPFPYLPKPTVPTGYLWMLAVILVASVLLVRGVGGPLRQLRSYTDLAFMGAAFLLLETKNIVQFALLFGTTWFVNSLVFAGVLLAVYLAIETARHVRLPPPWILYLALAGSLVLAWLVPQESLLQLEMVPRFLAGAALAFAPVFLANLIFAQRFAGVETSGVAFAANLLGAMVGGALEYMSLATGYRFLLIVVGVLYALAFLTSFRRGRGAALQPS
ncbi:MAG TPA: spermidine synthase [Streptosporangiaceae bacterium]|nr:spermidine synthase [Streptosporangiaceae bacterium]